MALCVACVAKQPAVPLTPRAVKCEVCYEEVETATVGAVICAKCSELANFCEVCKESIENF